MTGSAERLKPLVDLAGLNGQEAALRLARSHAEVAQAEQELDRISNYLDEYRKSGASESVSPGRFANDRNFVYRLAELVRVQAEKLAAVRARHDACVIEWQQTYRRDRALRELYERYLQREIVDENRRQQESMDELLMRWLDSDS